MVGEWKKKEKEKKGKRTPPLPPKTPISKQASCANRTFNHRYFRTDIPYTTARPSLDSSSWGLVGVVVVLAVVLAAAAAAALAVYGPYWQSQLLRIAPG